MTINKAIEIEEESANGMEKLADVFKDFGKNEHAEACAKNAAEHREVAEWLKSLKKLMEVDE